MSDADIALSDVGQPSLSRWPYDDSLGDNTQLPPAGSLVDPWFRASLEPLLLHWDGVEDDLEQSLENGRSPLLVIEVTDEFYFPDTEGVIDLPLLPIRQGRVHAVVCAGAVTAPNGMRYFLLKNSWGRNWGIDGFAWIPMDYVRYLSYQAAVATVL
ncbi:hypothetical protein HDC94_001082 [Leifsonia sp. AK011]|uniref:C1 family peptidase n=1 Tax=Leifsonia sp. AK011 TaxID=2723075 RepID=UPI0015C9D4C7|nr:C1 family peptidase [Leifsonia sp. AK011]NYF09926.1 hypothetical protein [Leifsonia sp. AK011]